MKVTVSCLMQLACDTYVTKTFLPEKEENRKIIRQSLYVEFIGHKLYNLRTCHCFQFVCASINEQLVVSNIPLSLT